MGVDPDGSSPAPVPRRLGSLRARPPPRAPLGTVLGRSTSWPQQGRLASGLDHAGVLTAGADGGDRPEPRQNGALPQWSEPSRPSAGAVTPPQLLYWW